MKQAAPIAPGTRLIQIQFDHAPQSQLTTHRKQAEQRKIKDTLETEDNPSIQITAIFTGTEN